MFLRNGIQLLRYSFRTKQDEILSFIKSFQQSTRSLQHFCGHSKVYLCVHMYIQVHVICYTILLCALLTTYVYKAVGRFNRNVLLNYIVNM